LVGGDTPTACVPYRRKVGEGVQPSPGEYTVLLPECPSPRCRWERAACPCEELAGGRVHPQSVRFHNVWFQNVRFQNVRFSKCQVYKTSGFKMSGFKTFGFKTSIEIKKLQYVQFLNLIYLLNKKYGKCRVCIPI
jgi:hypothetical protein